METKHITTPGALLKASGAAGDEGLLEAVFSQLDPHVDLDRDTTAASAFTPGQEVPLLYGHSWGMPAVGLGTLSVEPTRAIWKGRLFLDSTFGRDVWVALKHLQASRSSKPEFSWGFRVLEHDYVQRGGQTVRRILRADVIEISPVLRGAAGKLPATGENATGILAMKHAERAGRGGYVSQAEALKVVAEAQLALARSYGADIPETLRERTERELRRSRALGVRV